MTHLDVCHKLGLRLRAFREARGMSQDALAAAAQVARTHVCAIELGNDNVGVAELERLTNALGVTLGAFFSDPAFFEDVPAVSGDVPPSVDDVPPVRTMLHSSVYDERVLAAVKADPAATVARLRKATGYGEWRVYGALNRLRDAGRLRREGPRNAGRWVVIE